MNLEVPAHRSLLSTGLSKGRGRYLVVLLLCSRQGAGETGPCPEAPFGVTSLSGRAGWGRRAGKLILHPLNSAFGSQISFLSFPKNMRLTWSRPRQCRLNEGGRGQFLIHSRSFRNHLRLSKCTSPSTLEAAPSHTPRW